MEPNATIAQKLGINPQNVKSAQVITGRFTSKVRMAIRQGKLSSLCWEEAQSLGQQIYDTIVKYGPTQLKGFHNLSFDSYLNQLLSQAEMGESKKSFFSNKAQLFGHFRQFLANPSLWEEEDRIIISYSNFTIMNSSLDLVYSCPISQTEKHYATDRLFVYYQKMDQKPIFGGLYYVMPDGLEEIISGTPDAPFPIQLDHFLAQSDDLGEIKRYYTKEELLALSPFFQNWKPKENQAILKISH